MAWAPGIPKPLLAPGCCGDGRGRRAEVRGSLAPTPSASLFYDHCERAVAALSRRRAAAAWRAQRRLALLQHRKGNQVKLCRNSAPALAWPPRSPAAERQRAPSTQDRRSFVRPTGCRSAGGGRRAGAASSSGPPGSPPSLPHSARPPRGLSLSPSFPLSAAAGGVEPLLA